MYDYFIVGGGSAGCVLAARLSEDPDVRVCVLEAGPPDDSFFVRMPFGIVALMRSRRRNWRFRTGPEPNCAGRRMFWPRGPMLGGSSAVNAMWRTRGHCTDYDPWAALGNDGWGYADVLPYFKCFEHRERGADAFHGAGGPYNVAELRDHNALSLAFVEAAVEAGLPRNDDFNGANQEGVRLYEVMQKDGQRCSNTRCFPAQAGPRWRRARCATEPHHHHGRARDAGGVRRQARDGYRVSSPRPRYRGARLARSVAVRRGRPTPLSFCCGRASVRRTSWRGTASRRCWNYRASARTCRITRTY
jgi:choline dehydrogenase-like flavoprotein